MDEIKSSQLAHKLEQESERHKLAAGNARSLKSAARHAQKYHEARRKLVILRLTLEALGDLGVLFRCPHCHKASSAARAERYGIEAPGIG